MVNSTLFQAHPVRPPCPPLLHLPFSFSVPRFSLYAVSSLISPVPVLGVEGPGGWKLRAPPVCTLPHSWPGFPAGPSPILPRERLQLLFWPLVSEVQLYKNSALKTIRNFCRIYLTGLCCSVFSRRVTDPHQEPEERDHEEGAGAKLR